MSKVITLNREELLHPVVQIGILFCSIGGYSFLDLFEVKSNELISVFVSFIFLIILISISKISKQVIVKDEKVIKGVYIDFLGIVYVKKIIPISEIKEVCLVQDKELYFEIIILSNSNEKIVVNKIPNRNPAAIEFELVKKSLKLN